MHGRIGTAVAIAIDVSEPGPAQCPPNAAVTLIPRVREAAMPHRGGSVCGQPPITIGMRLQPQIHSLNSIARRLPVRLRWDVSQAMRPTLVLNPSSDPVFGG